MSRTIVRGKKSSHQGGAEGLEAYLRALDSQHSRVLIDILFLEMAVSSNLRIMCRTVTRGLRRMRPWYVAVEVSPFSGSELRFST